MDKQQKQSDALDRARNSQSMANYGQIMQGLTEKGIDPDDISFRVNVLTFDAWRALGRTVRRGEKGICLVTGKQKAYSDLGFCSTMRIKKECGQDALLFEAK